MATGLRHHCPLKSHLMDVVQCEFLNYGSSSYFIDNSYIYINMGYLYASPAVYFSSDFTVSFWVKFISFPGYWSRIVDFGNGAASDNMVITYSSVTLGQTVFQIFNGGTGYGTGIFSNTIYSSGTWYYVAYTLTGSIGRYYLNGNFMQSISMQIPLNVVRYNCYIGKSNWGVDAPSDMYLRDLKFFNRALSANEIFTDMWS